MADGLVEHWISASGHGRRPYTHVIQQLYEPFQTILIEASSMLFQVLVSEELMKEWSVLVIGGVELLEPCLDIRNRSLHARSHRQYQLSRAYPCSVSPGIRVSEILIPEGVSH